MTPFPFRKAHFIGLAGVGMSATAILLRDSGVAVTGSDESISFPAFFGVSADAANGPWSREATERTFLVAGVAGITQVFAAMCRSDSMNWAAHGPGASRQSDNDHISIS